MSKGKFYWYVPEWGDDVATFSVPAGVLNVGSDIIVRLIDTDFASPDDPRQDNFVVERIIGQYMLTAGATAAAGDRICHTRVYVADGDQTSVAARDLYLQDDADSSFLWHRVHAFADLWRGDQWGDWQNGSAGNPITSFSNGRSGAFDIKVGRRVEEGQALLWHTQVDVTGNPPADDTFGVLLWVRVLLREG